MTQSSTVFAKALQTGDQWIRELMAELDLDDPKVAYRVLRATLHALRDRLQVYEAVDLGAQLPTLIRGVFYEGWKPSRTPEKLRSKETFLVRLAEELMERSDPEPETAARVVFKQLADHVTGGEIEDVRGMLPGPIKELWP